jgi:hypothetical protein
VRSIANRLRRFRLHLGERGHYYRAGNVCALLQQSFAEQELVMTHYWQTFVEIIAKPFELTEWIWGIVPLYFSWFLNELTSSKASFRTAIQTGFAFVWAAAQWLFQYAHERPKSAPVITVDALMAVNMVVTLLVLAFGLLALISGIRRKFPKHCKFLGHTRFAAYFMIAMFPMQAHYLKWNWDYLLAILIFAVPVWLVVHVGLMPLRK